jgi:hypothetical protein
MRLDGKLGIAAKFAACLITRVIPLLLMTSFYMTRKLCVGEVAERAFIAGFLEQLVDSPVMTVQVLGCFKSRSATVMRAQYVLLTFGAIVGDVLCQQLT